MVKKKVLIWVIYSGNKDYGTIKKYALCNLLPQRLQLACAEQDLLTAVS